MTTSNSFITWPTLLPESTMTAHAGKSRQSRPALVKRLDAPAPPDEVTVRKLNELAAKRPFCTLHKVKKYEIL
ncbi:MAG TPA: hypothetical protein VL727_09765 [Puia sp.]|nr:hypothetical protein [Puia sp.]